MNTIESNALTTFQNNLTYFSQNHHSIYTKINILNQAINDGAYSEKYALEYKDGYFDVKDLNSNSYLYNENSNIYSKNIADSINYKKSEGVIETFYKQNVTEAQIKKYSQKTAIDGPLWAAAKIINYANNVTQQTSMEMKKIDKFIFAGVGLGIHLLYTQLKLNTSYLFIIENNLELFRLSLFVTDYAALSKGPELFFSIMDNDMEFRQSFESFFIKAYNYNQYLKYVTFSPNDEQYITKIQSYIVSSQYLSFPYSSQLKESLKAPEYLIQGYPFLNLSTIHQNSIFSTKPLLVVASGPSLGNNVQWLHENQDKFIIVAVLSSAKTLHKANIRPDIVVNIDASLKSPRLLEGINVKEFFKDTLFILSSVVTRGLIDSFPVENVYCFETASAYKQHFGTITAPSVGETAYAISLLLGAKELYLLGLDLSLDPTTNMTHAKEHHDSRVITSHTQTNSQYMRLNDTTIQVKGNFIEHVSTLPVYNISIVAFNNFSAKYVTNQTIYNLNNGAYLNNTIPLDISNLDTTHLELLNKNEVFQINKNFLDKISENSLNSDDIAFLDLQIQETERLYNFVLDFKQTVSTSNYDLYMKSFYQLSSECIHLSSEEKQDINIILYTYLFYVSGYIFDIFNTKNLKNSKRHLKKINQILVEELLKILNLYLTTMKVYREFVIEEK